MSHEEIIYLITNIKKSCYDYEVFLYGKCYLFALMLQQMIQEGEICQDENHVVLMINNKFYDITGEVNGNYIPLKEYGLRRTIDLIRTLV